MQKRKALPIFLFLIALISVAYASTTLTIPYTDFNTTTRKDYATSYTENKWTVSITCSLVFTNNTRHAKIFITNSSSTGYYGLDINIANDTSGYSYDFYYPTKKDPSASDWVHIQMIHNIPKSKTLKVILDEDGNLLVSDGITDYIDFKLPTSYIASYIGVMGSTTDVCSSGNVEIKISVYSPTPQKTIIQWMPIIVMIAMFSLALGLMRKFMK
jgi:hypothetical protein